MEVNMALSQRAVGQLRKEAERLSDEKIVEKINQLSLNIENGKAYVYRLETNGKSSYKKLEALMEEVYELNQRRSVLVRQQNRRNGGGEGDDDDPF